MLDFASEAKAGGVGFDLGVGTLAGNSLVAPRLSSAAAGNVAVQYGWVSVMPTDGLKVDAGLLATNVGYELVPSYLDGNILRGLLNASACVLHRCPRHLFHGRHECLCRGQQTKRFSNGQAVGVSATMGSVNGTISYFNDEDNKSIVDIIASSKVGSMTLAANIDFQTLAKSKKVAGKDDNAYGIALYATLPMGNMAELPMRLEYVNDGTSNIYGLNPGGVGGATVSKSAMSFTISPTYNFTNATFVRAELAYVSTDKKTMLTDDKGLTDTNLTVGAQAGVRF